MIEQLGCKRCGAPLPSPSHVFCGAECAARWEAKDRLRPKWLFWCDVETTGLNAQSDSMLEIAWVVTAFEYPWSVVHHGYSLVDGPGRKLLLGGGCFPLIREMHEKSGLAEALRKESGEPLETIERDLLVLSSGWSAEKEERVMLAGFSVALDLAFLREDMPTFAARLSHRIFDISTVSAFCRAMGMPRRPKNEAHRAGKDVLESIEHARACSLWMLRGAAPNATETHLQRCPR